MAHDEDLELDELKELLGNLAFKAIQDEAKRAARRKPKEPPAPQLNPILELLEDKQQPPPLLACRDCPSSIWLKGKAAVWVYCQKMHAQAWNSREPELIEACSGNPKFAQAGSAGGEEA